MDADDGSGVGRLSPRNHHRARRRLPRARPSSTTPRGVRPRSPGAAREPHPSVSSVRSTTPPTTPSTDPAGPPTPGPASGWSRPSGRAWSWSSPPTSPWPNSGCSAGPRTCTPSWTPSGTPRSAYLDELTRERGGRRGVAAVPTATTGLVYAHARHATTRAGDPGPARPRAHRQRDRDAGREGRDQGARHHAVA